ncbi:Protein MICRORCHIDIA 6 [Bienertia sinuspersici]
MGEGDMNRVKLESEGNRDVVRHEELHMSYLAHPGLDVKPSIEDPSLSTSALCPAPLCRQFWKAGNYHDEFAPKSRVQKELVGTKTPTSPVNETAITICMFTPSSFTQMPLLIRGLLEHAFCAAIAELIDNAIDEIKSQIQEMGVHLCSFEMMEVEWIQRQFGAV